MSERVQKYLSVLELSYCRNAISFGHSETDFLFYNNMEKEIWKDIAGYENKYQVSTYGRIKSLDYSRTKKERILKHTLRSGYPRITLCKLNIAKSDSIHRHVARTFIPNPKNKPEVNHIDGNKLNNHLDNLEWVTVSENRRHAFRTGLQKIQRGEDASRAKLDVSQVLKIREYYNNKIYSTKKIMEMFNCSAGAIYSIKNRVNWKHI